MHNRERRYDAALEVLQELRRLHPRNRLVLLEAGSTALRGKQASRADALLTEGLLMLGSDKRARMPGEEALWHYKRGAARVALKQHDTAVQDLQAALRAGAQPWVQGRARIELARVAQQRGDSAGRAEQIRQAVALCEQGQDPACVEEARQMSRGTGGR
jgi:tetratricopeptide (TPR) repeat protein